MARVGIAGRAPAPQSSRAHFPSRPPYVLPSPCVSGCEGAGLGQAPAAVERTEERGARRARGGAGLKRPKGGGDSSRECWRHRRCWRLVRCASMPRGDRSVAPPSHGVCDDWRSGAKTRCRAGPKARTRATPSNALATGVDKSRVNRYRWRRLRRRRGPGREDGRRQHARQRSDRLAWPAHGVPSPRTREVESVLTLPCCA